MTTQRIVWQKISCLGSRPEFWLVTLLLWALVSACRSIGTPWAAAAETEALRWTAGIGLALALGWGLRRTEMAGQFTVLLLGAMAGIGILGGGSVQGALTGPYRDHQLYGSVLLLLVPFNAGVALAAKSPSWRWGALAALTAGTLCLFLSETRGTWFGLAAAGLVFGGLRWKLLRQQKTTLKALLQQRAALVPPAVLLLGLLFGLLSIWLLSSPPDQKAALLARAGTLFALSRDGSWQTRLLLWRGTAHLVAAHPLFGIGLGRYPGAEWRWTHTGGVLMPSEHPSLTNEAHSFYGQTAAEIGLPGLALYLAALAALTALALRRLTPSRRRRHSFGGQQMLLIAAVSALAGQSVDALASPSWQFPEASLLFWAVLGLGLASLQRDAVPAADTPLPAPLRRAGRWAFSGGLTVALAAQILPMGLLLTPVEAYTEPGNWTLVSTTTTLVSPKGAVTPGTTLSFQVLANYKNAAGQPVQLDVTSDSGTSYGAQLLHPSKSYQNTSFPSQKFTLESATAITYGTNSTITITTSYIDHGVNSGKGTIVYSTTPAIPIQTS